MRMQQLYCGRSLTGSTGDGSDVVIIIILFIITKRVGTVNWPNETERNQNKTISH